MYFDDMMAWRKEFESEDFEKIGDDIEIVHIPHWLYLLLIHEVRPHRGHVGHGEHTPRTALKEACCFVEPLPNNSPMCKNALDPSVKSPKSFYNWPGHAGVL